MTEGDIIVLHDRLLRYELNAPVNAAPSQRAGENAPAGLRPPARISMRPDSPEPLLHDYSGDRLDAHGTFPPVTSSLLRTADTSGARQVSISEIINALRKWNLKCSGARGRNLLNSN